MFSAKMAFGFQVIGEPLFRKRGQRALIVSPAFGRRLRLRVYPEVRAAVFFHCSTVKM
ncbi:hypothetical protein [Methylobacterium sp. E-045]|uniref:hypothetical protein n=1 Tax=Methylobacterium sp. E-045 TaxID=2836575 RepID=UPI001FB944FE|nr:hypothetical protein [Methylobacterium sp. E-045]MCJ2130974.1 hypothetical protein [Methylobacterium sp. E-045]